MTPSTLQTQPANTLRRECFITTGATAAFRTLLEQSISPTFLSTLSSLSYTDLTIQCGPELSHLDSLLDSHTEATRPSPHAHPTICGITIKTFDFNKRGLGQEMMGCKAKDGEKREGVVISHAGAGTILDAMRIGVPLIVVPNPELLDNHQEELAEELERQGYVTYGKLSDLSTALKQSEEKSRARTGWPPVNSGERGVMKVADEELGYEARVRETLD